MAFVKVSSLVLFCLALVFTLIPPSLGALVEQQPLKLQYHNGPLLKGNIAVNLIWYGKFTPIQRSVIVDFIQSLSSPLAGSPPSAASWWRTTANYRGGAATLVLGKQFLHEPYTLGKSLKNYHLLALANKPFSGSPPSAVGPVNSVNVVLTASDVAVDGFCMNRCGTHGSTLGKTRAAYAWVGNPETQCPGYCAWPFHQPTYGPQTPPLVAPSGDVGVDGMIINLATVLAGAVTNPFGDGYYQGPTHAPLVAPSGDVGVVGTTELPEVYLESEDAVPASSPLLHSFESKPVIVATNLVPPPLSDLESPALDSHSKATVPTEVEEDEFVISKSAWTPLARSDSMEIPMEFISPIEKPPVSARFGHRKSVRAGSEGGKPLRGIAKPKRNETLENTWKMITEGRSIPLTRHLRKSDTWEHHNRLNDPGHNPDDPNPDLQRHVKKSDTFKDRTNNLPPAISPSPSPSIRLRKEPSLSQDELNRRVEAFIKKFNEEMRLQRQESLNQYYEMIKHGAH